MGELTGRVAVVTGASTGIGAATARTLAGAGAELVLAARSVEGLRAVAADIERLGGRATTVPTDVTSRDDVAALVDHVVEVHGGVDLLVTSAGTADWDNTGIAEADLDGWVTELSVNLLGTMQVTRLLAPVLRDGGHLVTVSSGADRGFSGDYPAYVTSKWGVRGFTGSAEQALRRRGVRATMISPGEVDTPMQPEGEAERMRMLDPDDVADAVLWAVTRPRHVAVSTLRINPSGLDG